MIANNISANNSPASGFGAGTLAGSTPTGANNLSGNFVDSDDPSMNPYFYGQLANNATSQAAGYYAQGQQAAGHAAPTINNPTGAQSRRQLQSVQNSFSQVNSGLNQTLSGGGINAGQAVEQQGLDASIANQLGAAHSGRGGQGGYNLGAALGAQNAGAAQQNALASQGATARGSQVNAAQSQLGQNLNTQGQQLLSQDQTQYQTALAQAQLQQKQSAINVGQAQALYGQSGQEQSDYTQAVNDYLQQAQEAQTASVKEQAQNAQHTSSILGDITSGIGDVASIAAFL